MTELDRELDRGPKRVFPAEDWLQKLHFLKATLHLNNTQLSHVIGVSRGLVGRWLQWQGKPREPYFTKLDRIVHLVQVAGIPEKPPLPRIRTFHDPNLLRVLAKPIWSHTGEPLFSEPEALVALFKTKESDALH